MNDARQRIVTNQLLAESQRRVDYQWLHGIGAEPPPDWVSPIKPITVEEIEAMEK